MNNDNKFDRLNNDDEHNTQEEKIDSPDYIIDDQPEELDESARPIEEPAQKPQEPVPPSEYYTPHQPYYQEPPRHQGYPRPENQNYNWDYSQYEDLKAPQPKKHSNKGLIIFLIIIGIVLVLAVVGIGIIGSTTVTVDSNGAQVVDPEQPEAETTLPEHPVIPEIKEPTGDTLTNVEIAAKVTPSVVGILRYENTLYGATGLGSGIIFEQDEGYYYIMTNAHVVVNGTNFKITLADGSEKDAELVGLDTQSDIAVVRFKDDGGTYTVAEMGDSDILQVGEPVLAIGTPITLDLSGSVTHGIISALNRNLQLESSISYIQTDAAINAGNSGGALANAYGQVIGINSAKVQGEGYEGIGFAIPVNDALTIIEQLMEHGKVTTRPVLGIRGIEVDQITSYQFDIPVGIMVKEVSANSNFTPNLQEDDIITHIDGVKITGLSKLKKELDSHKIGDEVELTIFRKTSTVDSEELKVKCILVESEE